MLSKILLGPIGASLIFIIYQVYRLVEDWRSTKKLRWLFPQIDCWTRERAAQSVHVQNQGARGDYSIRVTKAYDKMNNEHFALVDLGASLYGLIVCHPMIAFKSIWGKFNCRHSQVQKALTWVKII